MKSRKKTRKVFRKFIGNIKVGVLGREGGKEITTGEYTGYGTETNKGKQRIDC
jgi:hypothetical protein